MNLLNFLGDISTYSNFSLIGLADVVHLTCPVFELVTSQSASDDRIYRMIYIKKGNILSQADRPDQKATPIPSGSLLFQHCTEELRFRVTDTDLEAWIFYLYGNALPYYKEAILPANAPFVLPANSKATESLHRLIQLKHSQSLAEEVFVNGHVTALFSHWTSEGGGSLELPPATPTYLLAVKDEFDQNYGADFSLDELAARHKVNKYRLCREFSKYFELSPIKYLNRVRIQNACLLLISTDMHVGEIAATVGIENVNHFIRLFKAQMETTPLEYRQNL